MELLEFLLKSKDARKIFGKREIRIIEKQLLGINLTQSEKNRLSRDVRKKLEFIKDVSKFSEEFELKKGGDVKKIINESKNIILESNYFKNIKKIILFGSTAENQRSFRSDIDIAVEFNKIDSREATKFRIYVSGRVSDKVDIQVYNTLPEKIKKEIDQYGKTIYERKDK